MHLGLKDKSSGIEKYFPIPLIIFKLRTKCFFPYQNANSFNSNMLVHVQIGITFWVLVSID